MILRTFRESMDYAEQVIILNTLQYADNNVTHAAKILDVSRMTVYRLIKKHNIVYDVERNLFKVNQDEQPTQRREKG